MIDCSDPSIAASRGLQGQSGDKLDDMLIAAMKGKRFRDWSRRGPIIVDSRPMALLPAEAVYLLNLRGVSHRAFEPDDTLQPALIASLSPCTFIDPNHLRVFNFRDPSSLLH